MKNFNFSLKLLGFLFILGFEFAFSQTGLKIQYYTGTEQSFNIQTSGKLYFSGDDLMILTDSNASATSVPTSIIKKITFSTTALAVQESSVTKNNLILYPNPSSDIIRISAKNEDILQVKIFSQAGQLVLQGKFNNNEDINISHLQPGIYLVNVNSTTLKLIKK